MSMPTVYTVYTNLGYVCLHNNVPYFSSLEQDAENFESIGECLVCLHESIAIRKGDFDFNELEPTVYVGGEVQYTIHIDQTLWEMFVHPEYCQDSEMVTTAWRTNWKG